MVHPQVNLPYDRRVEHEAFIRRHRLNLELLLSGKDLDEVSPDEVAAFLEGLGYGPTVTIHAPFMDLSPGAVDPRVREVTMLRYAQVFALAERIHPRAVVMHSGYERWKYGHDVDLWLRGSMRTWPEVIERARRAGTRVAIENIFEDEPSSLARLLGELGCEDVLGVCFDTGHFNLFSRLPLARWLDALGPRIIELHLHDNRGDTDQHLVPGEGTFDFPELFRALRGKEVIHTLEVHTAEDVLLGIERLNALLQSVST
ncbi:MAG: sugar phosphate isomerase/epimerase [Nitrospirota bacterium]